MKRLSTLLLVTAMILGVVTCSPTPKKPQVSPAPEASPVIEAEKTPEEPTTPEKQTTKNASDVKLALLIPGSPTDGAWCQTGAESVQAVGDLLGCKVSIVEAATADKMKSEAEALADEGYDMIFGHGGQYANPFAEISGEYPDTIFVTMGGTIVTENQFPVLSTLEQCNYIAGVIAAKVTKTGKLGYVLGGSYPAYTKTARGFELGAKSINPDIEVMVTVLTNVDMNEAYESTMSQIKSGADVVIGNANQATLGSLKAAKENGVYYFGCPQDLNSEAPEIIIASMTQDFVKTYEAVVNRYINGTIKSEIQNVGLPEEAIGFVWNEQLKATLPEDVQKTFEEYAPKIISDEIHVPGENE